MAAAKRSLRPPPRPSPKGRAQPGWWTSRRGPKLWALPSRTLAGIRRSRATACGRAAARRRKNPNPRLLTCPTSSKADAHRARPSSVTALDRIARALGYTVISGHHIGDWGTQFGLHILGYRHCADAGHRRAPDREVERVYGDELQRAPSSTRNAKMTPPGRTSSSFKQGGDRTNWLFGSASSTSAARNSTGSTGGSTCVSIWRAGKATTMGCFRASSDEAPRPGIRRESEGALVAFLDEEKLPPCIVRKATARSTMRRPSGDPALAQSRFRPDAIVYVRTSGSSSAFPPILRPRQASGAQTPAAPRWFWPACACPKACSPRAKAPPCLHLLLDVRSRSVPSSLSAPFPHALRTSSSRASPAPASAPLNMLTSRRPSPPSSSPGSFTGNSAP